mmetsp:Transcript_30945/g.103140  ORF Transcript_30945/g.103140 Transcript_30945/m.103140 type:complete len:205 (+) Transcript_30945:244-858(+)
MSMVSCRNLESSSSTPVTLVSWERVKEGIIICEPRWGDMPVLICERVEEASGIICKLRCGEATKELRRTGLRFCVRKVSCDATDTLSSTSAGSVRPEGLTVASLGRIVTQEPGNQPERSSLSFRPPHQPVWSFSWTYTISPTSSASWVSSPSAGRCALMHSARSYPSSEPLSTTSCLASMALPVCPARVGRALQHGKHLEQRNA